MSAKDQYLATAGRELATTVRVLKAYPPAKADLRPHAKSKTARELVGAFLFDTHAGEQVLNGAIEFEKIPQTGAATLSEMISSYETLTGKLLERVRRTADGDLDQKIKFHTGPRQTADVPKLDVLWFVLLDSIHHRGQFSVYLRMADGKVPSIYGPTADEPWR